MDDYSVALDLQRELAAYRESDDHFYGAWGGGSKAAGGRPAGGGAAFPERDDAWGQQAYAKWAEEVRENYDTEEALQSYQDTDYEPLNKMLCGVYGRGDKGYEAFEEDYPGMTERGNWEKGLIDKALRRTPLPDDVTVWRCGNGADLKNATVGDTITRRGYTSTSLNREMAAGFVAFSAVRGETTPVLYRIRAPKGMPAAYLDAWNKSGTGEFELLLGRNTRWRIAGDEQTTISRRWATGTTASPVTFRQVTLEPIE